MPLEFAEFAHHYAGSTISEAEQRADFETFADMMECLARYFWRDNPHPNSLGIRFDDDTLALIDQVESSHSITVTFNGAASDDTARKKEP